MPEDFPCSPYNAVYWRLFFLRRSEVGSLAYQLRARALDGWQGVAYYFLSCTKHDEAFVEAFLRFGYDIQEPGRYAQEKELFGFFINGLASIESFAFSLFAIGTLLESQQSDKITLGDPKRVSVKKTAVKFQELFPEEEITLLMQRLTNPQKSAEFVEWSDIRNFLSHRAAPARSFFDMWIPFEYISEADIAAKGIRINETLTTSRRTWLARTIQEFLFATADFTARRL